MKIPAFLIAGFLLLGVQISPAHAQAIEEKHLVAGKFSFDPASGYIYLHGPCRQWGMFLKVPDQGDIDAYKKDWDAAFAKATDKYLKKLASWESDKKAGATGTKLGDKPVKPTPETFTIGDIETRTSMSFGPMNVFNKDKEGSNYSYFMKAPPGTYVYYGPILFDPNAGYTGACSCMGSVKFEVKPGVITDAGNFLAAAIFQPTPDPPLPGAGFMPLWMDLTVAGRPKPEVAKFEWGLPASLKSFPPAQADVHAVGKRTKFFGIAIARMPAIPGVLGYQRDKVIDLKAAAGATTGGAQP